MLLELLKALDFVDLVKTSSEEELDSEPSQDKVTDFFSMAGLWENRDINLETVRQQAWPRQ